MDGNRTKLTDVNPHLVCVLCHGYFVDATTITECLHSFCRSCIFRHLEKKSICPICEVQVHTTKLHLSLRLDKALQDIVYKLVPGLFRKEMQRRRDFYQNHPYRDEHLDPESRGVGLDRLIYSPDDLISLSLEFYNDELEKEVWSNNNNSPKQPEKEAATDTKRFLQCPAAFKMAHLKKFIRQKYGLPPNCNVEILYRRESLPDSYSLMDIAYIYTWKRNGPMRFYYRMPDFVQKQVTPLEAKDKMEEKTELVESVDEKSKEKSPEKCSKVEEKVEVSNGVRQMSKQDELSVSVLLSLGNVVESQKEEKDHEFLLPKPFSYPKAPNTPRPGTEYYNKKILNGKLNMKFSVNKIASALAKNSLKKLPWKKEEQKDPFAFSDSKSLGQPTKTEVLKSPELTVPPLKISLAKGNPRVDPSSLPPAIPKASPPKSPPLVPKSPCNSIPSPTPKSPNLSKNPPVPPLKNIASKLPSPLPLMPKVKPLWPAIPKVQKANGISVPERPEVTVKMTNGSLTITTEPANADAPMTHKLPCIPRPPIRKIVPGGVVSKTGPTLDQRIQQLYKSKNSQVPTESRLANWLNNRFQPKMEKPKSPEKETNEMCALKRKIDELRKTKNACEITHENPIPKTRDVTPDVSIEFLRAADMKSKEKTKRPVPALKAIQDVEKRKNTDDDKCVKKAKIDTALDLSATRIPRLPEPHWMLNRPLLANQFVPRST